MNRLEAGGFQISLQAGNAHLVPARLRKADPANGKALVVVRGVLLVLDALATEDAEQVVLEGEDEPGAARVALTSGAAAAGIDLDLPTHYPALVGVRAAVVATLALLLLLIGVRSGLSPAAALVLAMVSVAGAHGRFFVRPELVTLLVVPAAVWLLGSGLLGVVGIRRRKDRQ